MGKDKDREKTNKMLDQRNRDIREDRANNQARTKSQRADTDKQVGISRANSAKDYDRHRNADYSVGYQDVNMDKVFGPGGSKGRGGGGGGGGGGVDSKKYATDPTRFSVNPTRFKVDPRGYNSSIDLNESKGLHRRFGKTGGIDENRSRVAHGNFQEFAQTGGYSDQDKRNIRSRATSPISALYSGVRDESARMGNVQGGYGPGRGALASRLARDAAGAVGKTSLDADLGIMDRVNEGRRFGAGALDASEGNIQNTLQRGRMFGAQGLHTAGVDEARIDRANMDRGAGIDVGNQNRFSNRELTNMNLASSRDVGNQNRLSSIELANAQRRSTEGIASAGRSAADRRFNTGIRYDVLTGNANRRGGVDEGNVGRRFDRNTSSYGMSNDRYNNERGHNLALTDQELQGQGLGYRGGEGVVDQRMENNPRRRSWGDWVLQGAGAAAGVATGFGSLRSPQPAV